MFTENHGSFKKMGLHNMPSGVKTKILINEINKFTAARKAMVHDLVVHTGDESTVNVAHNVSTCMTIDELADFNVNQIEVHYCSCAWQAAIKYAIANEIKVINRSATFSFEAWREEERAAIQEFIDYGGIFVTAAGNNFGEDNSPTAVDNDYFMSVGTVNFADNSASTICAYGGVRLTPLREGTDNFYTDTSSASPEVAYVAAILAATHGMNFYTFKKWLADNAKGRDYEPRLESGETLLYVPVLEKVELCRFTIGSNTAIVKGQEIKLDQAPEIDDNTDRTLMPVRAVLEALGYTVKWDPATQSISVY